MVKPHCTGSLSSVDADSRMRRQSKRLQAVSAPGVFHVDTPDTSELSANKNSSPDLKCLLCAIDPSAEDAESALFCGLFVNVAGGMLIGRWGTTPAVVLDQYSKFLGPGSRGVALAFSVSVSNGDASNECEN